MSATFSRLKIYAAESFAARTLSDADALKMTVDLFDVRAWRFFKTAPQSFFEQYADDFVIVNVQAVDNFLEEAAKFLSENLVSTLTVCGRFSRQVLFAFKKEHQDDDIGVEIRFLTSPRALHAQVLDNRIAGFECVHPELDAVRRIAAAGMEETKLSPAAYWTKTFQKLLIEDIIPELGVRDRSVFFTFMKTLAGCTAQGLNWAAIGSESGISAPCARDWTQYLADIGVIDLVDAMTAPAPRRAKIRKKLYWTAPGLALWLSDSMTAPSESLVSAMTENLAYLAIKDALPQASFLHFLDTNNVKAQIIAQEKDTSTAFYFASESFTRADAVRSLKSLSKIHLVEPSGFWMQMSENPAQPITIEELTF